MRSPRASSPALLSVFRVKGVHGGYGGTRGREGLGELDGKEHVSVWSRLKDPQ